MRSVEIKVKAQIMKGNKNIGTVTIIEWENGKISEPQWDVSEKYKEDIINEYKGFVYALPDKGNFGLQIMELLARDIAISSAGAIELKNIRFERMWN